MKKISISASVFALFDQAEKTFSLEKSPNFKDFPMTFDEFIADKLTEDNNLITSYSYKITNYDYYSGKYPKFLEILYHLYIEIFINIKPSLLDQSEAIIKHKNSNRTMQIKETLNNIYLLFFDAYRSQNKYSKLGGEVALKQFLLLKQNIKND